MTTGSIKFVVSIATHYMTIDVMQASPVRGVGGAWKRWLAFLHRNDASNYHLVESITVQGNTSNPGLAVLFLKGLDLLRRNPKYVLTGATMEVILGPSLSRVGIVEMVSDGNAKLSNSDKSAYMEAWIAQHWKMHAADCVVCNIPIGHGTSHIVTCIEHYVVDGISSLCAHEGIQLTSCQPALVNYAVDLINDAMRSQAPVAALSSDCLRCMVFVECGVDGKRANIVHFLTSHAASPLRISRMWLNKNLNTHADAEVDQTVARIRVQHRSTAMPSVNTVSWPIVHAQVEKS